MITENLDTVRLKSEPIKEEELEGLVKYLDDELKESKEAGVGLSAIQVNIPKQVAIIRHKRIVKIHGQKKVLEDNFDLYNTEIIDQSQPFINKVEGCLSIPGVRLATKRYNQITIKNGDGKIIKFSGFLAIVVQHELDHWSGTLCIDREA